jgi:hypothetical protein
MCEKIEQEANKEEESEEEGEEEERYGYCIV